ncbi:MAG: TRAP transporter substrate-binding protein [Spirochaetes bacterium]|nr:TRAP transporter substrate-binding protein [Spirochaetota bacterium]
MKKITLMLLVLLVSVSTVFAGGRGATGPRVLRLACNQPDGYPTVVGALAFAEYVYRETGGNIIIEVHNNAVLGGEAHTVMLTQTGDIEFNRLGVTFLASVNPNIGALGMPGIYRDREHMFRVLDGPIGDEALMMMYNQQLVGLSWFDSGFRHLYNSVREVRTPADLQGLRIRVQEVPIMMQMMTLMGGSPVPMAMGEVYSGIQNNVIDGAENNWPSFTSWSHNEVASFFTLNGHVASPEMILVNAGVWRSFSADEQRIIRSAAQHGARVQRQAWIEYEAAAEAAARAAGVTVTVLTPEEQALFDAAIAPLYQDFPQFADIIGRIRATP